MHAASALFADSEWSLFLRQLHVGCKNQNFSSDFASDKIALSTIKSALLKTSDMAFVEKRIAFFKHRAVNSQPMRPGPIQIKTSCSKCITKQIYDVTEDSDTLIKLRGFDNLILRRSMKFSQYQSVQYHLGQIESLKRSLKPTHTIYVVAVTDLKDLNFLNMIFKEVSLPVARCINRSELGNVCDNLVPIAEKQSFETIALPIHIKTCSTDRSSNLIEEPYFDALSIKALLDNYVHIALKEENFDLNIVSVSISKEHDKLKLHGLGSLCVQISEAFSLQSYISRLTENRSTHLVLHLYFDAMRMSTIFAPHLVAFIMLYLERGDGLKLGDLIAQIDWFRKTSADTGMLIGFTGDSKSAVEFASIILRDYIHFDSKLSEFRVKVPGALSDYANLVTPTIALCGIISRAILDEFNKNLKDEILLTLTPQCKVRVMRENVLNAAIIYTQALEEYFPCRKPCDTVSQALEDTLTQMVQYGRYIKVEEPQAFTKKQHAWLQDYDSDDDDYYYRNQNNPALQTWLVLTQREYRLDRLNMFINAVDGYMNQ